MFLTRGKHRIGALLDERNARARLLGNYLIQKGRAHFSRLWDVQMSRNRFKYGHRWMGRAVRVRPIERRNSAADNNIAEKETIRMRAEEQNKQNLLRQLERGLAAVNPPSIQHTPQTQSQAQPAGRYAAAFRLAPVALLLTKVGNAIGLDSSTATHFAATINQLEGKVNMLFSQKDMDIDGKCISLSAGMNITAEIKTGRSR